MSCLDNLVGVRGCGTDSEEFFVNDLTGIKIPDFDKAISPEHSNASAALTDIISFATKYVDRTIYNYFSSKYQLKTLIENDTLGYYYDNKEEVAAQATYLTGYEVRIDSIPYLKYFIQGLRLFVNTSGIVPVYIYDLSQGKLLHTINVTAVAGEIVSVDDLDLSFLTKRQRLNLFIGYASTFASYKTAYLSPYTGLRSGETCENVFCGKYRNGYIYYRSAKILSASAKIASNVESNTTGSGLSINYSLQCSFTEVMCNARNMFALPILYKAGELIMKELKHSKRLTGIVTFYGKSHDELMQEYQKEHSKEMENILINMNMPESICFSCNPAVRTVVALP